MKWFNKLMISSVLLCFVETYKILGVFPIPSLSHQIVYRTLMEELARQGNNVTVITTHPTANPPRNYFQIYNKQNYNQPLNKDTLSYYELAQSRQVFNQALFRNVHIEFMREASMLYKENIHDEFEFDLIVVESIINGAFAVTFGKDRPVIGFSSFTGTMRNFEAMGNPTHPVFYTQLLSSDLEDVDFIGKCKAVFDYLYVHYIDSKSEEKETEALSKMFNKELVPVLSLEKSMDIFLLNIHPILNGIRPFVNSVVNLGCLHIKEKNGLPKDIQEFLDSSTQGVVYMSLGSNIRSVDLPEHVVNIFLETFKLLPFKVIWKFEGKLDGLAKNMFVSKWIPQLEVLAHPNVKVFITQCGRQSTDEAILEKVPMIGIPFFVDQFHNVKRIEKLKIGVGVRLDELSVTALKNAVYEVMFDRSYSQNIEEISSLVNDRPRASLEESVWWTLYTLRHNGASHLRSPSADISNFEYFLCDVIICCVLLVAFVFMCVVTAFKSCKYIQEV